MRHFPTKKSLQDECLLDASRMILVGVSGGADSLCLLDILLKAGYRVVVAHVNHQLRAEADAEMLWVQRLAEAQGLPFVAQSVDVLGFVAATGVSVEEAARELRYRFLFEQAARVDAQVVAVGHTADDQAETVLMNFLRGSGLNGLKGMSTYSLPNAWSHTIPLVRPLLNTWRVDTEWYCQQYQLHDIQDKSNLETRYQRNRLRHEVIPYLEQINPGLRASLVRTAQALQSDQQIVVRAVQAAWEACVLEQQADWVAFNAEKLLAQPDEISRQLLRRAMALQHPGLRDVDFDSVQRALAYLKKPTVSKQCDLVGNLRLLIEPHRVWVATWYAQLPGWEWPQVNHCLHWDAREHLRLSGGWMLQATWLEVDVLSAAQVNSDPFQAFLVLGQEDVLLEIRPRKNGDRYQPLGMETGSLKVSDYMINQKIPRRARAGWPLVCWGGQVAWIPGGAPAHSLRVQPDSPRALHLRLTRS